MEFPETAVEKKIKERKKERKAPVSSYKALFRFISPLGFFTEEGYLVGKWHILDFSCFVYNNCC